MATTSSKASGGALGELRGERGVLALVFTVVVLLSVVPIGRLLIEAFLVEGMPSLDHFVATLQEPATWRALRHTIETGAGGTLIALVVGGTFALVVALTDIRLKAALVFAAMLPMMIPSQVSALSWIGLLEPTGPMLRALGLGGLFDANPMYSPGGIMLLLGLQSAPVVFLTLRAGLRSMPADLVEAAQACSASRFRVIRDVVLPLMTPGLLAGASLAFIASIGNFGIPALLGMPARYNVLTVLIYRKLSGFGPTVLPEVASVSVLLALIALVFIVLQTRVLLRKDYRATGTSATLLPYRLGKARIGVEAACWLLLVLVLVLPMTALIVTSVTPALGVDLSISNLTLGHYGYVLFEDSVTQRAFRNSFLLSGGAAALLVLIAILFGFFLVWRPHWSLRVLNAVADLPYALPGTVVSIACILVFIAPLPLIGVSIYNTVWIIFVAYLVRFLTRSIRPVVSAYYSIDRVLDEAGAMCGASLLYRMRTIVLPLVAPTAFAAVIIVFLAAYNELTVSVLLWSAGSETVGVMIFSLKQAGDTLPAAAMSVLTVALSIVLMAALSLFGHRLPAGVVPWRA